MPDSEWETFAKLCGDISVEAIKDEMAIQVRQRKLLIEEQRANTEKPWLSRSVLARQGYTEAELDSICATCDKKWDSEINVLHITIVIIIFHTAIALDFILFFIILSV